MLTKPTVLLCAFSLLFLDSCQSIRKGGSQLQHSGFQQDYDFHQSIGLLVRRQEKAAQAWGTGTLVADLGSHYVGVTVRGALDACLAVKPPLASDCWLRFPANPEQTRFVYERVSPFDADAVVRELRKDDMQGLAFFHVEKSTPSASLIPLELTGNIIDGEPLNALAVGYGSKTAAPTQAEGDATMLRSAGVVWRPKGAVDGKLVTTFPGGMVGVPVFTFVPSPVDYRMVWKVIGFGSSTPAFPLHVTPFRDLLALRSRHPNWPLWSKLNYDETMTPNKTGALDIVSATAKQDVENFLSIRLIFASSDWDLRRFYFNGIAGRHLQEISLNTDNGKGVLDARVPLAQLSLPAGFPDLIIEYRTVSDYLMFAACFRGSMELGAEAPMTCNASPSRAR